MISGADGSNVNGTLDWAALTAQHNLSFAAFKATEGRGFRDPLFPAAWKAIGAAGLVRLAYHFAHPMTDAQAQADAFLAYVRASGLTDADLLVLDLEDTDGRPAADVAAWARDWCAAVHQAAGRAPVVYTFVSFAQAGNCAGLGGYPLWIADPSSRAGHPRVPAPWKTWALHQYDQAVLDLDVANYPDKAAMLAALTAGGWQEALMNKLPTLAEGAKDQAGHVFYVHRMQALIACVGHIKAIPSAACVIPNGEFDAGTVAGLKAIQAAWGLTQDGVCGPKSWSVLIAGSAS